jgi:hypothetical protein
MDDQLEGMWKEVVATVENLKKNPSQHNLYPAGIQTQNLLNTSLLQYLQTSLFGEMVCVTPDFIRGYKWRLGSSPTLGSQWV